MIGQTGGSVAYEPEKNVLAAIVNWVESGHEPDVLEGTKLADDSSEQGTVLFTRKHCRYVLYHFTQVMAIEDLQIPQTQPVHRTKVTEWSTTIVLKRRPVDMRMNIINVEYAQVICAIMRTDVDLQESRNAFTTLMYHQGHFVALPGHSMKKNTEFRIA
jgi:hypothetical protein